jgi:copper chaperone
MERVTLAIDGMSCGHCVRSVEQALKSLDGVAVEQVAVGTATVQYDPASTSIDRLKDAVEDEGYQVTSAR